MNLSNLNEKQKEAVTTVDGPLLVLAGAGSGKTRVLTTRVAYLVNEIGIDPTSILAITFTNKAAKEMRQRVYKMLGPQAYNIQISTFHSFCLAILKEYYSMVGLSRNFTILDSDDSLSVVKKILKDMNIDPKKITPKSIRNRISSCKNELISPEKYEKFIGNEIDEIFYKVYIKYQNKLKINNSVDFDDLLLYPLDIFKKYKDILEIFQDRFKYIMVDEYQDTNEVQYMLTKLLAHKYKNICVVGDNDQSIYSFRNANYKNILNFEKDYKNAKTVMLEKNYRSTKNILDVANCIIKNNKLRKDKNLYTDNLEGDKVIYHTASNEIDEALYVKKEIVKLKETTNLSEIAILYRTNAQSRVMEEALLKSNIPYKVVGSFYFYKRKEIKDLIAYLNVVYNPQDDTNVLRTINTPKRGIGDKTIDNLYKKANEKNISLFEAIDSGKELEYKKIILDIISKKEDLSLTELIEYILDKSKLREELQNEKTIEAEVRIENLEEFKSITKNFEEEKGIVSLEDFLMEISLVSDASEYNNNNDVVTLMTIHSAKGLEFDNVFIIGLEESIFPHINSFNGDNDIEEERRLCYVAITRAKKKLWLINARRRMLFGQEQQNIGSRFINEISKNLLDIESANVMTTLVKKENLIDELAEYKIGDKINHDNFGDGVVVNIDKSILTIAFPHPIGIKKLIKGHKSIKKL